MANTDIYPKILIITTSDVFKDNSSVALTIRSFMDGWPEERLCQVITEDFNGRNTGRIDNRTFVVGHDSLILGKYFGKERKVKTHLHTPKGVEKKKKTAKEYIHLFFSALYSSLPYKIDKSLCSFIRGNGPDIIYTLLTPSRTNYFVLKISKEFNLPIIPHFFDDWQNIYLKENRVQFPFKLFFYRNLKQIIQKSSFVLCISDDMSTNYKTLYPKANFVTLMHSVKDVFSLQSGNFDTEETLIYSGSLYLGRYQSLLLICRAIKQLNSDFKISVFAPQEQWNEISKLFADYNFVSFKGQVDQATLFNEMAHAFALIFMESLDDEYLKYTQLSMSTKVPEYLASQKPILAVGNGKQCSINYLKKNDAAYVATKVDDILPVCKALLSGTDIGKKMSNARHLYINNHGKERQKEKFYNIVISSIIS